ncbi:MAG: S9 family peptidase [Ktedonobacteraceae bacterium]
MATTTYPFERYLNVRMAYGASFSPDGSQLSFLTDITGVGEVWSVPVDMHSSSSAWPTQITFRGDRCMSATFAPKSNKLLITGDVGGNERTQLYLASADGATFDALTTKPEVMYLFGGWSPDNLHISYSSNERDPRYFDVYERNTETGAVTLLFQHDGTNNAGGYSPDGQHVLVTREEDNIHSQLLLLDRATKEVRTLTPETSTGPSLYHDAAWSADRRGLYLRTNRNRQFLSLAYLDLATNAMIYLSDSEWDIEHLALTPDGSTIVLVTNEDGYSLLELFDVSNGWGERKPLLAPILPRGVVFETIWSQDGSRLAITLITPDDSADIWVWDMRERVVMRVTHSAAGGIPHEAFVAPSLVHYPTFDAREIPAFLYLPRAGEQRNLPVVVYVHGGPEGQSRPEFNSVVQYLAAHGYGVFVPNVRGSTGYGYEYQSLDDVRLRMDSVKDLRYAVRWLCESGIADPQRIAVFGGSYGGFMVLSAVTTYPDLWAAGVDIVGIANFVTFLENTGPWRRKLRESEYGTLEHDRAFLEQISPIRSVDKITAPLFVVHGANDPRVPVGEAEQIVDVLRKRNVPVEYLRFEDEGHGIVKRANRLVVYPAIARFLDQHVKKGVQGRGA